MWYAKGITFNLIIIRVNQEMGSSGSLSYQEGNNSGGNYPLHNIDRPRLGPAFSVRGRAEVKVDVTHVTDADNQSVKGDNQWRTDAGSTEEVGEGQV